MRQSSRGARRLPAGSAAPLGLAALLGLSLLAPGALTATAAAPQDEDPAATASAPDIAPEGSLEAKKQRLARDLAGLDRAAQSFDPETRRQVPMFREILRRAYLERDTITESELRIARQVRQVATRSRAVDPLADLQALKTEVKKAPGIATKPVVTSAVRRAPGGRNIGVVTLAVADRKRTVAEIMASAGGMTPAKRADAVARRLRATHNADPLWWTQAKVGTVRNNYVVAAPKAPGGYVITADANFARERGLGGKELAGVLVQDIRSTYDRMASRRDAVNPTAEEKRAAAADLRMKGDEAFDRGDAAGAEQAYRGAVETDPDYTVAYQRLADLYLSQKKGAEARQIAESALARPNLDAASRKQMQAIVTGPGR